MRPQTDPQTQTHRQQQASTSSSYPWYSHPAYQRYWEHYAHVMSWCHNQQQSYYRATRGANFTQMRGNFTHASRPLIPRQFAPRTAFPRMRQPSQETPHRKNLKRPRVATPESQVTSTTSIDDVTNDVMSVDDDLEVKMVISDEMREFFLKSQQHREERDAKKMAKSEVEEKEKRVDATASVHKLKATISEDAPRERPGVRRTFEMKQLYGPDAAKIHGMETAMQLTFDRNCDRFQPKLWPIMPFKIKFS